MTSETISLDSLDLDLSSPDAAKLPDPGQYLWRVSKVRDAKRERNRFYNAETAIEQGSNPDNDEAYEDPKTGYWVYAHRTSVLIELTPIADSREDYDDLDAVYSYFDLAPKRGGGMRPGKQLRELIAACYGEHSMKAVNAGTFLRELEGATCWGILAHQKSKDGTKTYGKVSGFTDAAPARYTARMKDAYRDEQVANDARYGTEPVADDDDPTNQQWLDLGDNQDDTDSEQTTTERTLIATINNATDSDFIAFLVDKARKQGHMTPAVERALQMKAGGIRAAQRRAS